MRAKLLLLCVLSLSAISQVAGAAEQRSPRVAGYEIDAGFSPEHSLMRGSAVVRFHDPTFAGDSITFFLHGELDVDSVFVDSAPCRFKQRRVFYEYDYSLIANAVSIGVGADLPRSLRIVYAGYFNPSKVRSPSDYMRIDGDGVFLRAYGYSLWFPVFLPAGSDDYAVDFERVTTRLPRDYTGIFGGTRVRTVVDADSAVTDWRGTNIRLFEAQFTARPFQILGNEGNFAIFHLPDSASTAAAQAILEFSRSLCAQYGMLYRSSAPLDFRFIVEMPPYGDISSGSVTGLMESTWRIFSDDENAQRALAHELVHPYVRVDVSREDSAYCLVVEGFPSYFHLPCVAKSRGAEFYNRYVGWIERLYLDKRASGKDRRGNPLPSEKPLLAIAADEMPEYKDRFVLDDRALLFLNYLRACMGTRFEAFTVELFNTGITNTAGIRSVIEKHLPGSSEDIRIWLETTEYPERLQFSNYKMTGE